MTEIEKLRVLLAEARETLLTQHDPQDNIEMVQRIDAALAEPIVAWKTDDFWGDGAVEARVNGFTVSVYPDVNDDEYPWVWSVYHAEVAEGGNAPTKEDAMKKALVEAGVTDE